MLSKKEVINILKNKYDLEYDAKTDLIFYNGISFPFEQTYRNILKDNGMSFNCICDIHWENMSILECTECGTVIKYREDEFYEQDFRCPVCTDYKTRCEYHTKEEIASNKELQTIIKMYRDFSKLQAQSYERRKKRNGLNDWELCKSWKIKFGDKKYEFKLLIDSITNKNKLRGLSLEISKWKCSGEFSMILEESKVIPLSKEAYVFYKYLLPELKKHPELNPLEQLKGKPLTQSMEEGAVKKLRK